MPTWAQLPVCSCHWQWPNCRTEKKKSDSTYLLGYLFRLERIRQTAGNAFLHCSTGQLPNGIASAFAAGWLCGGTAGGWSHGLSCVTHATPTAGIAAATLPCSRCPPRQCRLASECLVCARRCFGLHAKAWLDSLWRFPLLPVPSPLPWPQPYAPRSSCS